MARFQSCEEPSKVLADAGSRAEANFIEIEKRGITGYVPLGREKHIVQPVFGWIKQALGFRSFSLRGLPKVTAEWNLVCLALNLKRMSHAMVWK